MNRRTTQASAGTQSKGKAHGWFGQAVQLVRIGGIPFRRSDDRQPPVQIEQPGESAHQDVVAFAGHQRADGQDLACRGTGAGAARRVIRPRHDNTDAAGIGAEFGGEPFRR